jgi:uncharacterized protein (DUF433 family)
MRTQAVEIRESTGGKSTFIKGSRVRVSDIARMVVLGEKAEEIQAALPHLTMKQVSAAIEYWQTHKASIQREIEEEDALLEKIKS